MLKRALFAMAVAAVAVTPATAQAAKSGKLAVATYNIHHAEGVDGRLDLRRVADELRATKADVIGLQEVDRHFDVRSEFVDQAQRLSRLLDMDVVYAANLDLDPYNPGQPRRQYGTAILSKFPIVSSRNTLLPRPQNGEQRGLLEAVVKVGGARVRVANTHLQHNSAVERTAQVEKIVELLGASEEPTVLVGDLNATSDAPELQPLFTRLPVTAKLTIAKRSRELAATTLNAPRAAEAKFSFTASAPNTDWSRRGLEAAVVTVLLDGEPTQDVVLYSGASQFTYKVALGRISAGRHKVSLRLNRRSSPPAVGPVNASNLTTRLAATGDLVARHAPILYGRDLPEIAGRWENARTDVPMLAYHASTPNADGTRSIEYTVIWSNEDGGTNTPALMARWGRTTDIEWIYRVRVDAAGNALDAVYHGPNHEVLPFTGAKEDDHPLLQTATSNNNLLQVVDPALTNGYRFFLDTAGTLPANRTREAVMDAEPWTYQVMAKEMLREGRLEATSDPATPEVSDQRNYLYLELDTTRAQAGVGTTLAARVAGTWYSSHHAQNSWSIDRDGPAATTIELPPGTSAQDVEAIKAVGVPTAATPPADWRIEVKALNRGFLLGADYLPGASFVQWRRSLQLTAAAPEAVIWTRP